MPLQVFTAGGVKVNKSLSSSSGSTLQYSDVDRPALPLNTTNQHHTSDKSHQQQQNQQQQQKVTYEEDTLARLLAAVQDSEDDDDEEEEDKSSVDGYDYEDDENEDDDDDDDEVNDSDDHEVIPTSEDEMETSEKRSLLAHDDATNKNHNYKYNQSSWTSLYQRHNNSFSATDPSQQSTFMAQHNSNKERTIEDLYAIHQGDRKPLPHIFWLSICFFGIMISFVGYGLLLEYSTSDGRQLHEMSFLFITSLLYTITAAAGRYVRDETPSTIPPARFALLGLTSMGSTWCSVRSLRFVIFPIQVLAKSCKPVPVMIMGAILGKRYSWRKYLNVFVIVAGVALFMGGGDTSNTNNGTNNEDTSNTHSSSQMIGIILLFISLCFDGGTGAYEDKLMSVHSVGPFDLMYNIQLGKTILAGIGLIVFNQIHLFLEMCQQMGIVLVALGLTGALGQVFIFVTIAKFGALTCSIIGLARKITTLLASILVYGHHLTLVQMAGLILSIGSMLMEFSGKKKEDVTDSNHPELSPHRKEQDLEETSDSIANLHPSAVDYNPIIVDLEMSPLTTNSATIISNLPPPINKMKVLTAGGT